MSRLQTNAIRHLGSAVDNLTLDNAGRILLPNQPAFFVSKTGSWNTYSSSVIIFDLVRFNVGSCYSTSTGRFTAPVAGRYLFSANIYMNDTSPANYAYLRVNGVTEDRMLSLYQPGGNEDGTNCVVSVLDLALNDYVEVMLIGTAYGPHSRFSGHFVG